MAAQLERVQPNIDFTTAQPGRQGTIVVAQTVVENGGTQTVVSPDTALMVNVRRLPRGRRTVHPVPWDREAGWFRERTRPVKKPDGSRRGGGLMTQMSEKVDHLVTVARARTVRGRVMKDQVKASKVTVKKGAEIVAGEEVRLKYKEVNDAAGNRTGVTVAVETTWNPLKAVWQAASHEGRRAVVFAGGSLEDGIDSHAHITDVDEHVRVRGLMGFFESLSANATLNAVITHDPRATRVLHYEPREIDYGVKVDAPAIHGQDSPRQQRKKAAAAAKKAAREAKQA